MGEEFIDKRNRGSCRRRDKQRAALYEQNLFTGCPPEQITRVVGTPQTDASLSVGDRLWANALAPTGPISFYLGDQVALIVIGKGADYLRGTYAGQSGPLLAEVHTKATTSGMIQIQVRSSD